MNSVTAITKIHNSNKTANLVIVQQTLRVSIAESAVTDDFLNIVRGDERASPSEEGISTHKSEGISVNS